MLSAKNNYKLSSKYSAALKLSLARLKALVKLNNNFTYIFYYITSRVYNQHKYIKHILICAFIINFTQKNIISF